MCIAIHKPAGVALPSWTVLETCFNNNDDGAGFAYPTMKGIRIVKGLMTFEAFKAHIEKVELASGGPGSLTAVNMLLHFRIGTHGDTRAATHTHPFPVADTFEQLTALRSYADYAMIHNGILSDFTGGYKSKNSDTMNFVEQILAPLSANGKGWYGQPGTAKLINSLVGTANKVAIMDSMGNVQRYGEWTEDAGIYWSNTSYKYSYARYGKYDDNDYGYNYSYGYSYGYNGGYDKDGKLSKAGWKPKGWEDVPRDQVDTQDYVDKLALNLPMGPEEKAEVLTKGNFRLFRRGHLCWLMQDAYLQQCSMRIEADDYYQKADDLLLFHQTTRHCWIGTVWQDTNGIEWYDWEYVGKLTMSDPYKASAYGTTAHKAKRSEAKKQKRAAAKVVADETLKQLIDSVDSKLEEPSAK